MPEEAIAENEGAPAELTPSEYGEVLHAYIRRLDEESLYAASLLSEACIRGGFGPEDIVALHFESLQGLLKRFAYREQTRIMGDAHQFLLEVMIAYGVRYKEYLELKLSHGLRDAEDRVHREHERAMEAERLTTEKEDLLMVIAHELRTPTTAAKGFVELAHRNLSVGKADAATGLLDSARQAIDRLSRLTADLSEAVRNGPSRLAMAEVDLAETVAQACDWAGVSAAAKGIRLLADQPATPVRIGANADALLTIVGNVLANAVRYTPSGGEVRLTCAGGDRQATVEIRDTGIGIAEDQLERIFEKFYRAPSARALEPQGLGLGLSLVRQLVEAHQGRIDIESSVGRGTVFRVTLPIDATRSPEEEEGLG